MPIAFLCLLLLGVYHPHIQDDADLVVFHCKEGNCSMKLPAQPTTRTTKTAKGPTLSYRVTENGCMYLFSVVEVPEFKAFTPAQIEKRLERGGAMDESASKITHSKKITSGDHPGRAVRQESVDVAKTDGMEVARMHKYIVGTRLYLFVIMGKKSVVDSDRSTRILESLRLEPSQK